MPARLNLTPEQYLEHQRALARERKRKQRSRDALRDGHVTSPSSTRVRDVRSPSPLSVYPSSTTPRTIDRRKSRYAQILDLCGYGDAAS